MHAPVIPSLISLLLTLTCLQPAAQPRPETKVKAKYDYLLYLPDGYESNYANYPLVIYLHGGSQKGNDLNRLKEYGLPYLVDQNHSFKFIIASPQCPAGKFWSSDNWFDSLYAELTASYRIDLKRIYLTGISMGGYGAWQTAVAYPDKFAAIMPLCGGCDDSTQICRIKNIPVWTFHGTDDDVISINETERLVKRLNQCGGKVKFTRLEKERHGIQHLYEDDNLYNWLLRQHK